MEATRSINGRCNCGAVCFTGLAKEGAVSVCHCDMCRRWSSGPYLSISCRDMCFEGEQAITVVRSSDWAERGFCGRCGSNIYYHLVGTIEYQIAVGTLDDQSNLHLELQVFTDRRPPFYSFAEKTKCMDTDDVMAAFGPSPD